MNSIDYCFQTATGSSAEKMKRDQLLVNDGDGVRFLIDFAFPWSYPGGPIETRPAPAAPATGAVVYDVAQRDNAVARINQAGAVAFAGNGLDFTAVTTRNNFIEIPASVATDLWTPVGGKSQLFAIMLYLKMPTLSAWADVPNFYLPAPLVTWSAKTGVNWEYADADIVAVAAWQGGMYSKRMVSARVDGPPVVAGVSDDISGAWSDSNAQNRQLQIHAGRLTQILIMRTEDQYALRFKSAAGTTLYSKASGALSTSSFAGKVGRLGISGGYGWPAAISAAHDFRLYRASIENLARSKRDPIAVADEDYGRLVGFNDYS